MYEYLKFFSRDVRSAQISHPHSNRLIVMARKMRYLLLFLTLDFVQNLARSLIDAFPDAMCALMFVLSLREYVISLPNYF